MSPIVETSPTPTNLIVRADETAKSWADTCPASMRKIATCRWDRTAAPLVFSTGVYSQTCLRDSCHRDRRCGSLDVLAGRSAVTDQPIHLVGHSFGGVVALAQALKGSLSLSQLTLYESVAVWVLDVVDDREMSTSVYSFLGDYRRAAAQQTPYACSKVIDFWGGEGSFEPLPDFVKDTMAPLLENNIRHWDICTVTPYTLTDLKGFLTPTRIVYGGQSNPAAQAIANHLNEHLPNSQKYSIDGASHSMLNTHFDDCFAALQVSFGERS